MPIRPQLTDWKAEDYFRAFARHKWFIVLTTLGAGIVMAAHMVTQPDLYQATTRILIEAERASPVEFRELTPLTDSYDSKFFQTEHRIITSPPVIKKLLEELKLEQTAPFSTSTNPIEELQGMIDVELVRGTKLFDIHSTSTDPVLAARITNTLADIYTQMNLGRKKDVTTGGVEWLREEVGKMEQKVRDARLALQEFTEEMGPSEAVGPEQQNTLLQNVQAINNALNATREKRIEAETKFRPKHPAVQELIAKERELELELAHLEQKLLDTNRVSIQYDNLLREAKTSEEIYNVLLTRMKELSIQEGLQTNNVQVMHYAEIPEKPIGPNRTRSVAFAAFFGLLVGCGISMLREAMVRTIRNRQEFEQLLEIPFLGSVPYISTSSMVTRGREMSRLLYTNATFADMIRSVRTTLEFLLTAGRPYVLLITSAVPQEGKSSLSINLTVALQELKRKAILIDCDLRRPSLHQALRLPLEPGLSDFLSNEVTDASKLIQTSPTSSGVTLVPAGLSPPEVTDLFNNPKFRELLESWKQQYQYIIIDSPPVLVAADAAVLSTFVDGVIFVVRAGRTHSDAAMEAKRRLSDVGAKIVGGVLNGATLDAGGGYGYYYKYYRGYKRRQPHRGGRSPEKASDPRYA